MSVAVFEVTKSWWRGTLARMRETGCGKLALLTFLVAFIAHLGLVPGESGVWAHEAINYDDPQVIHAVNSKSVPEILTEPTYLAYKPVYFLSLKLDAMFDGDLAGFSHMVNLLLHAWVAMLLVLLVGDIFRRPWLAFAVGLLFAVHPVHVESIAWLSERKDTLSLLFVLWAHWSYRCRRERGGGALLVPAIWLLLGGLTKGTVWTYVGVIAVDEWMWRRERDPEARGAPAWLRLLPLLVVAVGGIVLDLYVGATQGPGAVQHDASFMELVAAMAGVFFGYVQHLVVPLGLSLDYAVDPAGSFGDVRAVLGVVLLVASVVGFVMALRRGATAVALALAFWIFGLAPVNNVLPKTAVLMADRYLYIPAIGAYLLAALLLARLTRARAAILAVLVIAFGVLTVMRTRAFRNSEAVWSDAIAAVPGSALAHAQRANARVRARAYDGALADAEQGIALANELRRPEIAIRSRLVRCKVFEEQAQDLAAIGKQDGADLLWRSLLDEATLVRARIDDLDRDPKEGAGLAAEAWVFSGRANEALGFPVRALEDFQRAVRSDPDNGLAHYNYATALATLGSAEALAEAESHLKRARTLVGSGSLHELVSIQLATVLGKQKRGVEAVKILKSTMSRYGRTAPLLYALATVYLAEGGSKSIPRVKELLNEIRSGDRDHPKAARLQADIYVAEGRALLAQLQRTGDTSFLARAISRFDLALEADKSYWNAHVAAGDALYERGLYKEARERYEEALSLERRASWIDGLITRTLIQEAAWVDGLEGDGEEAEVRAGRAATLVARALDRDVPRIDLGFVPLEEERRLLREVAEVWRTGAGIQKLAARDVLRAAARLSTGDYRGADEGIQHVLSTFRGAPDANAMVDAALLMRGLRRFRSTELTAAGDDFALLARRRRDDPLPKLKSLQVDMRVAQADLTIAQGFKDEEPEKLEAAREAIDRLCDQARAFADAHPKSIGAGLVAAEADMQQQEWSRALRRLNDLEEHHPRHPAIYRGRNAIYIQQRVVTPDEDLQRRYIVQASRELQKAASLDPRNVQTHLDSAILAQTAQDWNSAIRHARKAFNLQGRGGAAATRLARYLVMRGRQARDGGQLPTALKYIQEARQVDPGNPAPFVLEGEIIMASTERGRLEKALELGERAYQLAPLDTSVATFLGDVHDRLGTQARLRIMGEKRPVNPMKDPRWEAATGVERGEMIKAWDKGRKAYAQAVEQHREDALKHYQAALAAYPATHEKVGPLRERIESVRNERSGSDFGRMQEIERLLEIADREHKRWKELRSEADAEQKRFAEAHAAWRASNPDKPFPEKPDEQGRLRGLARQMALSALRSYERVVALHPRMRRGHTRIVELAWALLPIWDREDVAQRAISDQVVQLAFMSLRKLDRLDPAGGLHERFLYRGLFNAYLYFRDRSEEARLPAERNLAAYLDRMGRLDRPRAGDKARRSLAEAYLERVRR